MIPGRTPGRTGSCEQKREPSSKGERTQTGDVDVLGGEQEQVDSDARLDALLGSGAVEGVLRDEKRLLAVGAVQLRVLAVLERSGADGGQRSLEDVDLAAEVLLRVPSGGVNEHAQQMNGRRARTSATVAAFIGPPSAASTIELSTASVGRESKRFSMTEL